MDSVDRPIGPFLDLEQEGPYRVSQILRVGGACREGSHVFDSRTHVVARAGTGTVFSDENGIVTASVSFVFDDGPSSFEVGEVRFEEVCLPAP